MDGDSDLAMSSFLKSLGVFLLVFCPSSRAGSNSSALLDLGCDEFALPLGEIHSCVGSLLLRVANLGRLPNMLHPMGTACEWTCRWVVLCILRIQGLLLPKYDLFFLFNASFSLTGILKSQLEFLETLSF